MSLKGFLKACAKAAAYFAVYFVWQVIVVNWVSILATFFVSSEYGDSEIIDYATLMDQITERVYAIVDKYSLHITIVAGALAVLTFVIIFKVRKKKPLSEMGITKIPLSQVPVLIIFGLSLNMFISVFLSMIPFPESWVESYNYSTGIVAEAGTLVTLVATLISAPIVEEITFRGLVYSRLCKGMPMFAAMLISSWIFGVVHGNVIQMLYAALLGYIICYTRVKYQSLTACILVHFGFNLFSFFGDMLGEVSESMMYVIMLGGAAISLGLLSYISRRSEYKIEFTMKENENDQTHTLS